jgi:outer membrane protein assembly factor BamB
MKTLLRALAVASLLATTATAAVTINTRSYDAGRTGWNRNETILKPANVTPATFHKVGEIRVDDKIEASPLYVAGVPTASGPRDLVIVATTKNSVYAFDAVTLAQVWATSLGDPVLGLKAAIYDKWGITSTPVVDPDTNTLFVVGLAYEGPNKSNKVYRLHGLRVADGVEEFPSQLIDGSSVQRGGRFFRNGEQIIRTALALWRNPAGAKAIIFGASGGEDVTAANGWIVAFNVAQLRAGGRVTPAVWCSTPQSGGGGIWMASQGVAIDESDPDRDIYFATGNGNYAPQFGADDLGETVVRLHFDPNANTLNVVDWFTPFKDADHDSDHRDQDLGAAGVLLVPNAKSVLAGGKEGIFYNVDRTNMGKLLHTTLLQLDFIGTFTPAAGFDYLADTNRATTTDGVSGSVGGDRTFIPHPADGGRTRHFHGGPVYFEHGPDRLVFVMGENSTLRVFRYNGATLTTTPIAESAPTTAASGNTASPGGMPGGFLSVSSDPTGADAIVWSISPRKSLWRDPAANEIPGPSILRAFSTAISGATVTELWNSEMDATDAVGTASKFQPPLVANGRVYVSTYDNKVIVYGNTPSRLNVRDVRRTMILIKGVTQPGQDMFLRGGIDHAFGNAHGRDCPAASVPAWDDPRRYNCAIRIEHRNPLDYGENHEPYPIINRWQVNDNYLDWYGPEEFQTYQRRGPTRNELGFAQGTPLDWTTSDRTNPNAVVRNGFGFLKENFDAGLGDHYWMLDVDMDCETAVNLGGTAWFEVKSFITNAANGWEADVQQADRPWVSGNHFAKCGKINIFERGSSAVTYRDFDTVNQCSLPNVESRCDASLAQMCVSVGSTRIWQTVNDCVQSRQLCQPSTGRCCTPSNGDGSNRNCL